MRVTSIVYKQDQVEKLLSGHKISDRRPSIKCPASVGDLIWVRESFAIGRIVESNDFLPSERYFYLDQSEHKDNQVFTRDMLAQRPEVRTHGIKWKHPRAMSQHQSQLTLKVIASYQEHLQDITHEQARNEGMPTEEELAEVSLMSSLGHGMRPKSWFKKQWNDQYGNWDDNPIVWVLKFELIKQSINEYMESEKQCA